MLICVGIPCHDGKPCAQMVDSLLAEQVLAFGKGVHFLVLWEIGNALIGHARNKIASKFMAIENAQSLVFVDADISWTGGDLARLAMRPESVIGGTYRQKSPEVKFHVFGDPKPSGELWEVNGLPGGFLKISRDALNAIPARKYRDRQGNTWSDWFPVGFEDDRYFGEDYGFCRNWRKTGGTVWLDPSIRLRHHDGSRFYDGDVGEWLKRWQ